jgi:hypothetical protein
VRLRVVYSVPDKLAQENANKIRVDRIVLAAKFTLLFSVRPLNIFPKAVLYRFCFLFFVTEKPFMSRGGGGVAFA